MGLKSLLSRVARFLEPQLIEMYSHYAKDGGCYMVEFPNPLPRVILVTDRLAYQCRENFEFGQLGYEEYDREITMRASYYARRPWLWLLKAGVWARDRWYRLLRTTHRKLWHVSREPNPGAPLRWRDARPGPVPLGWFGRVKLLGGTGRGEVWIRLPRWVYNLRLLVPVNFKTEMSPGPTALYLQFGCPGWKKWPKHHLWKLAHVQIVP